MKHFILILFVLVFLSCKKDNAPSYGKKKGVAENHLGKKLMENKCYVCHNLTNSHDDRIAPPINNCKIIILVHPSTVVPYI